MYKESSLKMPSSQNPNEMGCKRTRDDEVDVCQETKSTKVEVSPEMLAHSNGGNLCKHTSNDRRNEPSNSSGIIILFFFCCCCFPCYFFFSLLIGTCLFSDILFKKLRKKKIRQVVFFLLFLIFTQIE